MKKARKENVALKRSCERKRTVFTKILNEHHIVAIKEHAVGEGAKACLAHSLTAPTRRE
jgi:hypothetical protein